MTRLENFLRAARAAGPPAIVALCLLIGLTLHEVVPRYRVERLKQNGERWQDHPSFLVGDCAYYRATLLSLLEDGDLDLKNNLARKQYSPDSNVSEGRNGAWYPKHSLLMPIAAAPFYLIAGDIGLLGFNLIQLTGLLMLMWFGACRHANAGVATALLLWFAFGTMLRPTAYNFAPDVFSSLLVVGSVLLSLSGRAGWAGLCLGLAVWAKWTNLVFLPVVVLFFLARRDLRKGAWFGLGAAVPLLALLALNQHMFGSPFVTSYDRVLILQDNQLVLEASHRTFFGVPFWSGLWEQLTDKRQGLLVACPPCLLALPGAWLLLRRSLSEGLFIVAACVAQLVTFAKYEQWQASSYGPRFLLTVVALSALLAAPFLDLVLRGRRTGQSMHAD